MPSLSDSHMTRSLFPRNGLDASVSNKPITSTPVSDTQLDKSHIVNTLLAKYMFVQQTTYLPTYLPACLSACLPAYLPKTHPPNTYIHTYILTYIPTYLPPSLTSIHPTPIPIHIYKYMSVNSIYATVNCSIILTDFK
jgi:hypothetical protein